MQGSDVNGDIILQISGFNPETNTSKARKLSGRMPDSQSSEPGFESPLLPFRRLGIFVLSIDTPVNSAV